MTDLQPDLVAEAIDNYHESLPRELRQHLGASLLGHHCDRWIWLSFRWAIREKLTGRQLRLFRRGHRKEDTVVSDLEAIGCTVARRQERIDLGCHCGGSIDGTVTGVPGAPKTEHLLEVKTSNASSFAELKKHGVLKAKPQHEAQMQLYMRAAGLTRALYVAVCKDTDELYTERVHARDVTPLVERGHRLALAERMPEPCNRGAPDWYLCKMCPAHEFCWKTRKIAPEAVSCRTCCHVTPTLDGAWHCDRWRADVPPKGQEEGCDCHTVHIDLVPWKVRPDDSWDWTFVFEREDGSTVAVGEDGVGSREALK